MTIYAVQNFVEDRQNRIVSFFKTFEDAIESIESYIGILKDGIRYDAYGEPNLDSYARLISEESCSYDGEKYPFPMMTYYIDSIKDGGDVWKETYAIFEVDLDSEETF